MTEETIHTKEETPTPSASDICSSSSAVPCADTEPVNSNIVRFTSDLPVPDEISSDPTDAAVSDTDGSPDTPETESKASETADYINNLRDKASEFTEKASAFTSRASDVTSQTIQKAAAHLKSDRSYDFSEEEEPVKKQFHFRKDDKEFFRDKWILSRIKDDQLMAYLELEQKRNEMQQTARDIKEKRIFKGFQVLVGAAATVAVVFLLKDEPTILVNILYITGILTALIFWKHPKDKL